MTREQRIARVRVNSAGEWKLLVPGTDIYISAYRYRHPELEPFPGNELGHQLLRLGWMPDRRAMYGAFDRSDPQKLALTELGGWVPSDTEDGVWTIPVYREV